MVNVKFNLMNIYMDYKISRLVKYGLVILNSDDEYLAFLLKSYIETYIKTYYYHQFMQFYRYHFKNIKMYK